MAYIPKALKGHAVLVAMACEKIIMSPAATMGDAGNDEKVITNTMLAAYEEIARRRLTVPPAIALGMLDKAREVFKVKTETTSNSSPPANCRRSPAASHPRPGNDQAAGRGVAIHRRRGPRLGDRQVPGRRPSQRDPPDELSPGVEEGDPSGGGAWRPIRVKLKGPIRAGQVASIERLIDEERRKGAISFAYGSTVPAAPHWKANGWRST